MTRSLILFAMGLFFGGGFGYVLAAGAGASLPGHDHGDPAAHMTGMAHDPGSMNGSGMDHAATGHSLLDATDPVPGVAIVLHPDGPESVNLEIRTNDFRFAPEHVNGPAVPGEGHAHVYVDGVKIARAYGPWFQITGLSGGEEIRVTLNANSHRTLADDGRAIAATAIVPRA